VRSSKRFSENAIAAIKAEIEDSGGNEVFALGYIDDAKLVARIEVSARGNEGSVLAIQDRLGNADVLIHNHPSGFLTPSDNDLIVSSRAAEAGIGSYIVDNQVENVYVVVEPIKRRKTRKLDPVVISAALEPDGAISRRLSSYEIREAQLELMRLIIRGFNDDALVAAEAGTGVGKSFAYLLPALSYAAVNDERIVISTATITLQEQLYRKDIPMVADALNKKIKTVLVKGRGNYLCRRRLDDALRESSLFDDERRHLEDIARWAETTGTGSRSDIAFMPEEGLWSRVCSEADNCMGMRCGERERCFVMLLRREASDAKVLVVNHHLLFADLAARRDGAGYTGAVVLPPYTRVIIDEAHTSEEAATSFFSSEFSRLGIYRGLGRLYRKRRAQRGGLLVRLLSILPNEVDNNLEDRVAEALEKIRGAADSLDETAMELCGGEGVFRLRPQRDNEISARLSPEVVSLRKNINFLANFVRELLEHIPKENEDDPVVWEIRSALRRLDTVGSVCASFLEYKENSDDVMWIERRGGEAGKVANAGKRFSDTPWAVFNVTPLDVAPSLKEALFEPNKTVVCVSATLTTGGLGGNSFDYWKSRSGLSLVTEREILCGVFNSDFPYESNVLLASPFDAPLPTEAGYGAFVNAATASLAEVSGGSALILFTSYQALRGAYETAVPLLEKQGIRVLKQGDDDRNRLLASFLKDESS
jgi:ATP-dependent DNA helicase DinG